MLVVMLMTPVMLLAIAAALVPLIVAMRRDTAWRASAALAHVPRARSGPSSTPRSTTARASEPWHRC